MSSAAQVPPALIQQDNYGTLATLIALGYDYVLTLPAEIEYIWTKRWTWVSLLFILVRYPGICTYIFLVLLGTTFLPGPIEVGKILYIIAQWTYLVSLVAADITMVLRVWAMYNRSKLILRILLISLSLETVSILIATVVYSDPRNVSISIIETIDSSICWWQPFLPVYTIVFGTFQVIHGTATCILAAVQFGRQSIQVYRLTKQCQVSRYMNILTKQGILYYLCIVLCSLINVLGFVGAIPLEGWLGDLLFMLTYGPLYILTPRFILNIREMYAYDVQGRRGEGIDTGFGLSSSTRISDDATIVFAGYGQNLNEGSGNVEEVPLMEFRTKIPSA